MGLQLISMKLLAFFLFVGAVMASDQLTTEQKLQVTQIRAEMAEQILQAKDDVDQLKAKQEAEMQERIEQHNQQIKGTQKQFAAKVEMIRKANKIADDCKFDMRALEFRCPATERK